MNWDLLRAAAFRSEADEWRAEADLRRQRAEQEARAMETRATRLLLEAAALEERYQDAAA